MTQEGGCSSWQCMLSLAGVQNSEMPMVVHPVLAGGNGEGSPQLQHERIIPQWKTAGSPTKEKVRHKISHFQRQELTSPFCDMQGPLLNFPERPVIAISSVSGLLCPLCALVLKIPDGTFLHCVTNF